MALFAADQIDRVGVIFDVLDHFHGQDPSLKSIAGVIAALDAIAVGIAVAHGVALVIVHGSKGWMPLASRVDAPLPSSIREEILVIRISFLGVNCPLNLSSQKSNLMGNC